MTNRTLANVCTACVAVAFILGASYFDKPERTTPEYHFEELSVEYEYGNPPYEEVRGTFGDYDCTEDCSGHEAGYEWAEEKGIEYMEDCSGNSQSFIEGCEQYVKDFN